MDFTGLAKDFSNQMVEQIAKNIYQQIVWEYII